MQFYISGTGSGDRNNASYVIWEKCNGAEYATYVGNPKRHIYLTIVHIWDKQHGFPLVVTKEEIPTDQYR